MIVISLISCFHISFIAFSHFQSTNLLISLDSELIPRLVKSSFSTKIILAVVDSKNHGGDSSDPCLSNIS